MTIVKSFPVVLITAAVCGTALAVNSQTGSLFTAQLVSQVAEEASAVNTADAAAGRTDLSGEVPDQYLPIYIESVQDGSAVAAKQVLVSLVADGRVVARRPVGVGGVAQLPEPPAGHYAIIASGPEGFAAVGMFLTPDRPREDPWLRLIPPRDMAVTQQIIRRQLFGDSEVELPAPSPVFEEKIPDATDPEVEKGRRAVRGAVLYRDVDGTVTGRLVIADKPGAPVIPLAELNIYLIRGSTIVSWGETNVDGLFALQAPSEGHFTVVAAGDAGFAGMSVPVEDVPLDVDPELNVSRVTTFRFGGKQLQPVLVQPGGGNSVPLQFGATGPENFGAIGNQSGATTGGSGAGAGPGPAGAGAGALGAGGGAGAAGGGGAGVGGGGGFGGVLGAVAGAGIGAGLGAALADDGNEDRPASPFRPAGRPPFTPLGPPFTPPGPPPTAPVFP